MKTKIKTNKICLKRKFFPEVFKTIIFLVGITLFNLQNMKGQNLEYILDNLDCTENVEDAPCTSENINENSCNNKISDFISVDASISDFFVKPRPDTLILPDTHTFQQIFSRNSYDETSFWTFNMGLSAYVPKQNSTTEGFLCINNGIRTGTDGFNSDGLSGGATFSKITFDENIKLWEADIFQDLDFSNVGGTSKNSSGAVTPWGTFISSENHVIDGNGVNYFDQSVDDNGDEFNYNDYYKYGWQVEIDPAADEAVLGKRYEMGRFKHENIAIHPNQRTIYQGDDGEPTDSYLYKFVADSEGNLSSGNLYVYKADGNPVSSTTIKTEVTGKWLLLDNKGAGEVDVDGDCNIGIIDIADIPEDNKWGSNNVKHQADCLGATPFNQMEDVEIGPCGKVYFIDVDDNVIYYLEDSDPLVTKPNQSTVNFLGVYVGGTGKIYQMKIKSGVIIEEPWQKAPDNMEFDKEGNLYIGQDNYERHIWMVEKGHTVECPKVKIMALTPKNFTPKGITFSPDNRFMFLSLKYDNGINIGEQNDASETAVRYDKNMTLVIARKEHLGVDPNIVVNANATIDESLQSLYVSSQSIETEVTESDDIDVITHIKLNEGFKVETGACLNATIAPCE